MSIREVRAGGVIVLAVNGRLDSFTAPAFEAEISRALSEGAKRIVFDCSGLEYISSTGLRLFLGAAKQMQTAGGRCSFAALSPQTERMFQLSNFFDLFEVYDTVADACL